MAANKFQIIVNENFPINISDWNALALQSSNLWQSTYFDETQIRLGNKPVYFQCYADEELVGGVKLFYFESRRLPGFLKFISHHLMQKAEIIFNENHSHFNLFSDLITTEVLKWCGEKKVSSFNVLGFYGDPVSKLVGFSSVKRSFLREFEVALIDLKQSEDELWHNMYPKHRSEVNKAHRYKLKFVQADNINSFLQLLEETYRRQTVHMPDLSYVKNEYEVLNKHKTVKLFFVYHEDKILCGALLQLFGNKAVYAFGGSMRNSIGAGQFLQWEIFRYLKKAGYETYQMGEVAKEIDEKNLKFSLGISRFKKRFGTVQHPSLHKEYVFRSGSLKSWNILRRIFARL